MELRRSCKTTYAAGSVQTFDASSHFRCRVKAERSRVLECACEVVCQEGWEKINWRNNFSALHLAAQVGSVDAVKLLLENGATPGLTMRDSRGCLPVDYVLNELPDVDLQLLDLLSPEEVVVHKMASEVSEVAAPRELSKLKPKLSTGARPEGKHAPALPTLLTSAQSRVGYMPPNQHRTTPFVIPEVACGDGLDVFKACSRPNCKAQPF